jgi:hypothetical protein
MSLSNVYEGHVLTNLLIPNGEIVGGLYAATNIAAGAQLSGEANAPVDTAIPAFDNLYLGLTTVEITEANAFADLRQTLCGVDPSGTVVGPTSEPLTAANPNSDSYDGGTNYMRMPLSRCDFDKFFEYNASASDQASVIKGSVVTPTTAEIAFYQAGFDKLLSGNINTITNTKRIVFPTCKDDANGEAAGDGWGAIKSWFITPCANFDFSDAGVDAAWRYPLVWGNLNSAGTGGVAIKVDDQGIFNASSISIQID